MHPCSPSYAGFDTQLICLETNSINLIKTFEDDISALLQFVSPCHLDHCCYHRHLTKLYVGSALVLAMYSQSSELCLYLWENRPLPTVQGLLQPVGSGCAPERWVSPIFRSPQQQDRPPLGGTLLCPRAVGGCLRGTQIRTGAFYEALSGLETLLNKAL